MNTPGFVRALLAIALAAGPASAELTRIEITSRAAVLDGKSFGLARPYEGSPGKAYFRARSLTTAANKADCGSG